MGYVLTTSYNAAIHATSFGKADSLRLDPNEIPVYF